MFPSAQETAAILRKRDDAARERQMAREAEVRRQVIQIVQQRIVPPARAWLIGSLAWGGFGSKSDVDLVVSEVNPADELQVELTIARAVNAEVDVLKLEHLPESFRERILTTGLRIV